VPASPKLGKRRLDEVSRSTGLATGKRVLHGVLEHAVVGVPPAGGPVQGEGAWKRLLPAIVSDVATASLLTFEELRRIRLPVLLIYGDRDVFVPVDHAVAIYRQLPDARLMIAPNSPHTVMVSQPALFNQAAANFYRSTEQVARERATVHANRAAAARVPAGDGASLLEPSAIDVAAPPDTSDPFHNW